MPKRPHILILHADQMQHDRMGFVDGIAYTPNLDALAGEGVHFTHAVTEQGQCVPSRAVLLTGQSAHECGVMVNYGFSGHQNMLTSRHQTLPKVLRAAGYDTAWFGKGHLGSPLADLGFDHGHVYDKERLDPADAARLGCEYVHHSIVTDYKATEDTVSFLRDRGAGERPLFLVASFNFPHPPFFSERRFIDRFPLEDMALPESFAAETFADKPAFIQTRSKEWVNGGFDAATLRQDLADYYSMIAAMDDHVGQIIAEYKRLGIWDDTLVLFTSDHGDMMGAHRLRLKGTFPYDELYRIPCLMKLPAGQIPARRTVDDLVCSQAFPGTLAALAGLEVPSGFTGGSFAGALSRECHPDGEHVFFEHYAAHWGLHPFYGVRTRTMKAVRYYGADASLELYDLAKDPHELHNLATKPAHAAELSRLIALADVWWQSTGGRDVAWYESADFKANRHNLQPASA